MKDRPALAEPAVTLVSHASVLIEAGETVIWCDPWLGGKVFADSWALVAPPAAVDKAMAESTHIWISHEHPDHFHLQTLRDLPDEVKQRVTLLFQDDGLPKMPDAFRRLGFPNIQLMPHRKIVQVGDVGAYCYQQGLMNSALAVRHGNTTVININDCELTALDSKLILDDLGSVDLTLNQFSLAGYNGSNDPETWSTAFAAGVIENLLTDHERLGASVTIPFASFIYFCRQDNAFLNKYCNRPSDVVDAAATRGIDVAVLTNGETYRFGSEWDSDAAVKHWNDVFERVEDLPCDPLVPVGLDTIAEAVASRRRQLHEFYPSFVVGLVPSIVCEIPDLGVCATLDLAAGTIVETTDTQPELRIHSEALHFAFATPFGLQSIGVGARYINLRNDAKWRRYRMLLSLNNAGVGLRPSKLANREFLAINAPRIRGAASQLKEQLRLIR